MAELNPADFDFTQSPSATPIANSVDRKVRQVVGSLSNQQGQELNPADFDLGPQNAVSDTQSQSPMFPQAIRAALKALKPPTSGKELSETPLIPGQALAKEYGQHLAANPEAAPEFFRGLVHLPSQAKTDVGQAYYTGSRVGVPLGASLILPAVVPALAPSALGAAGEAATGSALASAGAGNAPFTPSLVRAGGIAAKALGAGATMGGITGTQEMAGQALQGKSPQEALSAAGQEALSTGIPAALGTAAGESIPALAEGARSSKMLVRGGAGLLKAGPNIPESYGEAYIGSPGKVFGAKSAEQIGSEWDAFEKTHGLKSFGQTTKEASGGYVPSSSWLQDKVKSVAAKIQQINNGVLVPITKQEVYDASKAASTIERMAGGKFPNAESAMATQSREFWNDKGLVNDYADTMMPGHAQLRQDTLMQAANDYGNRLMASNKGGTTNILRPAMAVATGHPEALVGTSPIVVKNILKALYKTEQAAPAVGSTVGNVIGASRSQNEGGR